MCDSDDKRHAIYGTLVNPKSLMHLKTQSLDKTIYLISTTSYLIIDQMTDDHSFVIKSRQIQILLTVH